MQIAEAIGTIAIVASSAELIAQAANPEQTGLINMIVKDNANAQRITKGVIGGIAALSILGIAFNARSLDLLDNKNEQ